MLTPNPISDGVCPTREHLNEGCETPRRAHMHHFSTHAHFMINQKDCSNYVVVKVAIGTLFA